MKALIVKKKLLKEIISEGEYVLATLFNTDIRGDVLLTAMEDNNVYGVVSLDDIKELSFEEYMQIKKIDPQYYGLYKKQAYYGYVLSDLRLFTEKFKIERDANKDFLFADVDDAIITNRYLEVTLL